MAESVWRVVVTKTDGSEVDVHWKPEGWDEAATEEHRRFAVMESDGDGYNEPMTEYPLTDRSDGRPYFRIPRRRKFLSKTPAVNLAAAVNAWPGLSATIERADLGPWTPA